MLRCSMLWRLAARMSSCQLRLCSTVYWAVCCLSLQYAAMCCGVLRRALLLCLPRRPLLLQSAVRTLVCCNAVQYALTRELPVRGLDCRVL